MSKLSQGAAARRLVLKGIGGTLGGVLLGPARAADRQFPWKPIQIIVPYPPGGSNDNVARLVAKRLHESLGQPVIVDNKPGAGGLLGVDLLARSQPDGHVLGMVSSSFATSAAVVPNLRFDPVKDIEPVARVAGDPLVITVSPRRNLKSLRELIELAKLSSNPLTYGSSGIGSANHFATELLANAAGIRMVHVPYKGISPALMDMMGGLIDVVITSVASVSGFLRDGRLTALAVTGKERLAALPNVPSVREIGLPEAIVEGWAGFIAPSRVPRDTISLLNRAINAAMRNPEIAQVLTVDGANPFQPLTQPEFKAIVQRDLVRWRAIARAKNIKPE